MKTANPSGREPRQNSPVERAGSTRVARNNRSRITNGALGIDLRTAPGRRWRDLHHYYLAQTGGRNETLVRTLVTLIVQREHLDARVAAGATVDPHDLIRTCGAISRLMSKLGLIDEAPAYDATQDVIAAFQASSEARPA
jgi:hypothetical protein